MRRVLAISCLICLLAAADTATAGDHDGSLGDSNLRCIGRWDLRSTGIWRSHWGSAYLRTGFTGTTIKARFAGKVGILVSIDGEPMRPLVGNGLLDLAANPLVPGEHTLVLAGDGQNQELCFQGLVLDPEARTRLVPARPLIEFVGDSITACPGPGGHADGNYAWLAAETLGCDHVQIAFSGVALVSGFGFFKDRTGFDTWYFRLMNCNHADTDPWDFTYQPDLVVVNLGTNDVQAGKRPSDESFAISYRAFLGAIRARLPGSDLVAMRPFGGFQTAGIRNAVAAMAADGDRRVHFIDTEGWLKADGFADGIHPTVAGHALVAARLAQELRSVLLP